MPKKKLQKSLQDYLSKIKSTPQPQIKLPSKKWILSGCKHPKTPSFSLDDKKNDSQHTNNNNKKKDDEATLDDIDRFLFENFKSLYLKDDEETDTNTNNNKKDHNTKRVSNEESDDEDNKGPKLGPIFFDDTRIDLRGSNRFFMTRGFSGDDEAGSSSTSITLNDSSSSSRLFHHAKGHDHDHDRDRDQKLPDNCVAVLACSSENSPYEDFKRSMQGMVEARLRNNERVDWDFMEELLFCHINLNEKKSHKFILSAFVDLITAMRRWPENAPAAKPRSVRTVRIGREVRKKTKEFTVEFGSS